MTRQILLVWCLVCLLPGSVTAAWAHAPWPHEIYIWQRAWTPALSAAVDDASFAAGWRVLGAEIDAPGRVQVVSVDWAALAATRKPVVAVIRVDGHMPLDDQTALLAQIRRLLEVWRQRRATLAGLEVDYDSGVSRLGAYASFLKRLRAVPDLPPKLSVTALPAWLSSPDFAGVEDEADEVVLQVHAVLAPQAGLFNAAEAGRWIRTLAARDERPFRVALPDYGTRVVEDDSGRIVSVESETQRLMGGAPAEELIAAPAQVAALLDALAHDPPRGLAGFVWFRLPVEGDSRIWSLSTLRAVIAGRLLSGRIEVVTRPGATTGLSDILLSNDGDTDLVLPGRIDLPPSCAAADGINGYTLASPVTGISLERLQNGLLPAHHRQLIGWMRCARGNSDIHVRP